MNARRRVGASAGTRSGFRHLNARSTGSSGASRLDFLLVHVHSYAASSRSEKRLARRKVHPKTMEGDDAGRPTPHAMATHPGLTGSGLAVLSLPLHLVLPAETSVLLAALTLALIAGVYLGFAFAMGGFRS